MSYLSPHAHAFPYSILGSLYLAKGVAYGDLTDAAVSIIYFSIGLSTIGTALIDRLRGRGIKQTQTDDVAAIGKGAAGSGHTADPALHIPAAAPAKVDPEHTTTGMIEVELPSGVKLRVSGDVSETVLRRVLSALS